MNISVCSTEDDPPKDESVLRQMYWNAIEKLRMKSYNEALAIFDEILVFGSTNFKFLSDIYKWYGRTCKEIGQIDKAYTYFDHELQMHRLTRNVKDACDAYRHRIEICVKKGNLARAKNFALELVEFATDENDMNSVIFGRLLIARIHLDEAEKPDNDKNKASYINEATTQISECRKVVESGQENLDVNMMEARCEAIGGDETNAFLMYTKCIDGLHEANRIEKVHECYFEMAKRCHSRAFSFVIDNLRSAVYFASKCNDREELAEYTIYLAKCLGSAQKFHEGLSQSEDALQLARELKSDSLVLGSISAVSKNLIGLKKWNKAAYYLVFGSVMASMNNYEHYLQQYYEQIDIVMTESKKECSETASSFQISLDPSDDVGIPNDDFANALVTLEHTTTFGTWKIAISDIIEERRKANEPKVEPKEEEEEMDIFEMIAKMNHRMDDQRVEGPSVTFARPNRPISSQSKKKAKSHRLLPGLRANIAKLNDMKIDKKTMNRFLKKTKSKLSVNSDSTSLDINADATISEMDTETMCSASDLASCDSISLNKENIEGNSSRTVTNN